MKICKTSILAIVFVITPLFSLAQTLTETASTQGNAAPVIAEILIRMRHSPSEEDKLTLQQITENEVHSDAIRTIAKAVHDFEHKAQEDDVEALKEIAEYEYATAREKTLADVVANMQHMPNDAQTDRLAQVE